jgi:hypothetical protein
MNACFALRDWSSCRPIGNNDRSWMADMGCRHGWQSGASSLAQSRGAASARRRMPRAHSSSICELDPSKRSKPVQHSLLQEAREKLARPTVKSERPGLAAGAFAFCGVRTAFCDKGLRAWRSRGVGQRRGLAEVLADRRGRARGMSLRASRDLAPQSVSGSQFQRRKCTNT